MRWKALRELVEVPSPSGHEQRMVDYIRSFVEEEGIEYRVDALGNIVVNPQARWGFGAHIDEVSFIVSQNHPIPRGTIPDTYIHNAELESLEGTTYTVSFGEKWSDSSLIPPAEEGTVLVWRRYYREEGDYVVGTGLDNKVSVFVLLEVLRELDIGVAFTVQEEGGSHGARALSYWLEWEDVIVLDTAPVNWKVERGYYSPPKMGGGVYLMLLGGGSYPSTLLLEKVKPYVDGYVVATFTGGEFRRYFETRPRRAVEVLVPIANMHSSHEIVMKRDVERLYTFISSIAESFGEK